MGVRLDGAGEIRRRDELAQFLRTRRQRLSPSESRLPWGGGRRRTPGLRREEVALMANVSVSWYASLEQGRDVRPSAPILGGIARALRLPAHETHHLFVLAGQVPPPGAAPPETTPGTASPTLRRVMDDLVTSPAWAMTAREDLAYWNDAADAAFLLSSPIPPPHDRNLMWKLFLDPAWRELWEDWETVAQSVLARFRANFASNSGSPAFERLVEDLERESPEFREWWPRHDVMEESEGTKTFVHPEVGPLTLDNTTLQSPADPGLKVVAYVPSTCEDRARLEEIMAKANGSCGSP